MQRKSLFLLALACLWSLGAAAQWQWIDQSGRKVFSDRPPPQEVPEHNILKQPPQPRPAASAPAAAEAGTDGAPPAAAAPQPLAPSGRDPALEKEKARLEAAEAARRQAEEAAQAHAQAQLRADNCARARQLLATLNSGATLAHVNASGERVLMDDATRATELRRAQDAIRQNC